MQASKYDKIDKIDITISGPAARRGGPAAGRCVARMGTQAAHAHLHEIECVERLGLNSRMRALLS